MPSQSFLPTESQAKQPFELVHIDVFLLPVVFYHKYKYFLTFLNDCTSHGWITMLKSKSDTNKAIWQFVAMVKNQFQFLIGAFMTDFGGEFKSFDLTNFFKDLGIAICTSVPHIHQQNGCAECFNRAIMEKAQAICLDACIPESWWEFAVLHAMHLYNRTPVRCIDCLMRSLSTRHLMCHTYMSLDVELTSSSLKKSILIN